MVETFVNVCAWLNRIDYWWLSKMHHIYKQHCASDILKTCAQTMEYFRKLQLQTTVNLAGDVSVSDEQRGLHGFLSLFDSYKLLSETFGFVFALEDN